MTTLLRSASILGAVAASCLWATCAFSATIVPAPASPSYPDGRPTPKYRLDAQDAGVVLRHGDGPKHCDQLGARDVWGCESGGTYYVHYLSAFFEASRRDYYELLLVESQRGEWNDWLQYFLNGVTVMSEDAIGRTARIVALLDEWRIKAAGGKTDAPLRLLVLLADNPFVTVTGVAEKLDLAFTTAQRAIQRLEQLGVLKQKGEAQRGRVYCAQSILDLLEEPARLNRWEAAPTLLAG